MTLQETMINQELANADLSKIAALQQKRTLAFVNHFVLTNVQFLNNFMKKCDQKLMNFERKLEKVNAAMVLLEARLSSIPEVNTVVAAQSTDIVDTSTVSTKEEKTSNVNQELSVVETPAIEVPEPKPTYPEYDRFIKMVQVGVPLQAVKLKASLEGLDPNILDELVKK